jgi:hypothetical protein
LTWEAEVEETNGTIINVALQVSFEVDMGSGEAEEVDDSSREGVKVPLKGRRASFVENLVFFENKFAGRRLQVDSLSKSMIGRRDVDVNADAAIDDTKL